MQVCEQPFFSLLAFNCTTIRLLILYVADFYLFLCMEAIFCSSIPTAFKRQQLTPIQKGFFTFD